MLDQKMRMDEEAIALRAVRDVEDGQCINLGHGIPVLASNKVPEGKTVYFQAEHGVVGYGPTLSPEEGDLDLTNASGQPLAVVAGISFCDSAEAFAMIRGGHIDVAILGAYQVSETGDLANWTLPGKLGVIGGAMDLAACAKRVIVTMHHVTGNGLAKIVKECAYPVTARQCVDLIVTDIAVIEIASNGLVLREVAPGWTAEDVQTLTEPTLIVSKELTEIRL